MSARRRSIIDPFQEGDHLLPATLQYIFGTR